MQDTHLNHKYSHTLQQIFQHPETHHLEWSHVLELIKSIGTVHEEENGKLTFTLNGHSETFHRKSGKEAAEIQQVVELRHFLEKAGFKKDGTIALPHPSASEGDMPQDQAQGHDHHRISEEQNRRTEQQLKTQQHEQNERSAFQEGDAQSHQQGNRQK